MRHFPLLNHTHRTYLLCPLLPTPSLSLTREIVHDNESVCALLNNNYTLAQSMEVFSRGLQVLPHSLAATLTQIPT